MSSLKERVKSLQADTTNTDTALTTLEEALAEKVSDRPGHSQTHFCLLIHLKLGIEYNEIPPWAEGKELFCHLANINGVNEKEDLFSPWPI